MKLEIEYESLLEKIICFLNVLCDLKNLRVFAFLNVKNFLSAEELKSLFYHCRCHDISLLLLESHATPESFPEERRIIITSDLCEIVENFEETWYNDSVKTTAPSGRRIFTP